MQTASSKLNGSHACNSAQTQMFPCLQCHIWLLTCYLFYEECFCTSLVSQCPQTANLHVRKNVPVVPNVQPDCSQNHSWSVTAITLLLEFERWCVFVKAVTKEADGFLCVSSVQFWWSVAVSVLKSPMKGKVSLHTLSSCWQNIVTNLNYL